MIWHWSPLTRQFVDQIDGEGIEVWEPRLNLKGLRDESTSFLYKLRLNIKLSNVMLITDRPITHIKISSHACVTSDAIGYLRDAEKQ